jgi:signal transduction histidine kinase
MPHLFLFRAVKNQNSLSQVIQDSKYDFFFAGWFMGIMNLSFIPSFVFGMGALTNYLAMRGFKKLYRILLMPAGCLPILVIENFEIHFESSNTILFLSLGYSVLHYLINSYILYYSGNTVRLQNIEIENQRREIQEKSEQLKKLNQYLNHANSELEEKVRIRTKELVIKNKKLEEYTFMNAHKLRAPIATILGLIHLLNFKNTLDNTEILEGLKKQRLNWIWPSEVFVKNWKRKN